MKFLSTFALGLTAATIPAVFAAPSHLNRMNDADGLVDVSARNPADDGRVDIQVRDVADGFVDVQTRAAAAAALEIIPLVIDIGKTIAEGIIGAINDDKEARSEFTQKLVAETRQKFPDRNVVVCHTKHNYKWDGERGKDWEHRHQEFDIQLGGTIGYEIYVAKGGTFNREGDGGYLNWAYAGKVTRTEDGGKTVIFAA